MKVFSPFMVIILFSSNPLKTLAGKVFNDGIYTVKNKNKSLIINVLNDIINKIITT